LNLDQIVQGCPPTELLYLREMNFQESRAKVTRVVADKGNHFYIVLDKSIFHPKGGGQPSDKGTLSGQNFQVDVKKVIDHNGILVYWVKGLTGTPVLGEVRCELDLENRRIISEDTLQLICSIIAYQRLRKNRFKRPTLGLATKVMSATKESSRTLNSSATWKAWRGK